MTLLSAEERSRFWSKVDIRGEDECWPWIGAKTGNGYGAFCLRFRLISAHRVLFPHVALMKSSRRLFVCHKCDNKICCNPRHLFVGTPKDNTQDMIRKGRRGRPINTKSKGDNHPSRLRPECLKRGEEHGMAKLSKEDVLAIRCSPLRGIELAELFKVSPTHISRIKRGRVWRCLETQP